MDGSHRINPYLAGNFAPVASEDDFDLEITGEIPKDLHGAFYLGSPAFYDWLRTLPDDQRRAIGMRRISLINELQRG